MPVSTTVFLARHASHTEVGRILSGRSEIGLSDAGRAEAAALGLLLTERLAGARLGAIHSSPRRRARETAAIVAERQRVAVGIADALDEIDFGEWTGRSFAELDPDPAWQRWNAARGTAATPTGETMAAVAARAVRHIEQTRADRLLCVSHGDVIRGVVAHYLGLDADRLLSFDVDPASLTTLVLEGAVARLVALNERAQ